MSNNLWGIQVKIFNKKKDTWEWLWVKPSCGYPYRYDTEAEAQRMRDMCYPESPTDVARIKQVGEV